MKLLRNAWVSGALALIAIIVVVYQFVPLHPAGDLARVVLAPALAAAPAPHPTQVALETSVPEAPKLPVAAVERTVAESRFTRWLEAPEHDPFQQLSAGSDAAAHRYPSPLRVWKLKAIWRQTGGRVAAIDNHVYTEGDKVQGYRILKIDSDRVVFEGPDGPEVLTFPPLAASKPVIKK